MLSVIHPSPGSYQLHWPSVHDRGSKQQAERILLLHLRLSGMQEQVYGERMKESEPNNNTNDNHSSDWMTLIMAPTLYCLSFSRTRQSWECTSGVTPSSQRSSTTWCATQGRVSHSSAPWRAAKISFTVANLARERKKKKSLGHIFVVANIFWRDEPLDCLVQPWPSGTP